MKRKIRIFLIWLSIAASTGVLTGASSALLLALLEAATNQRLTHPWLLWLLPLGGAMVSYIYMKHGRDAGKGNNLVLEQLHAEEGAVPLRMAPLVLFGTMITHLFGGSAGREGTAVQMGGSLASYIGRLCKLGGIERKMLLICGISGGFGSVFGTPLAGAIFSLELLAIGLVPYWLLLPALAAGFTGHAVALGLGTHHSHYAIGSLPSFNMHLLLSILLASVLFGLMARLFIVLTHKLKALFSHYFPNLAIKSFVGGLLIVLLVYILGTRDYLGLGLPLMEQAFHEALSPLAFLLKMLFTAVTLGAGFQGGEVTPLFVIGSALGSALGGLLSVSVPLLAGIGFVAVFGSAANTPLAAAIMGMELFGLDAFPYLLLGCFVSYLFSGHTGIYWSKRTHRLKLRFKRLKQEKSLEETT
ncbi:chloride channel protein [Paenibacillus sp. KS-LC4]|uniref:chloride channel protein n=1 Tax=Paenibacillus sp. KS-LC4 TaxID=2979727 RepID=UPI0030CAAAEE